MSTIEIDLDDYISDDRRAEIVEEAFRQALTTKLREAGGVDRILSNISYFAVFEAIDQEVQNGGDTVREKIREQAFNFINQGRNYGIFRSRSSWEDASAATKIVEQLINEKRDLIRDRAEQAIRDMPFAAIKEEIKYAFHQRIDELLAGVPDV